MEKNPTMLFVVAVALTNVSGMFLLQKRPEGRSMAGLWEFPGGKVEHGEIPESALIREIHEELGIQIDAQNLRPITFASEPIADKNLLLLLYLCDKWTGEPCALEGQELCWVAPADMRALAMPPADAPFIDFLERLI